MFARVVWQSTPSLPAPDLRAKNLHLLLLLLLCLLVWFYRMRYAVQRRISCSVATWDFAMKWNLLTNFSAGDICGQRNALRRQDKSDSMRPLTISSYMSSRVSAGRGARCGPLRLALLRPLADAKVHGLDGMDEPHVRSEIPEQGDKLGQQVLYRRSTIFAYV